MKNEGPSAFKPDVYGSTVIIERHIDKSGASSYKFRSTNEGKILASKREELTQYCDQFSIVIDSPITVLTQDQARSFLQSATPATLYKVCRIIEYRLVID
jgi:hypothetical protein